jgi:methylthioribose-1-phosphate isomerase
MKKENFLKKREGCLLSPQLTPLNHKALIACYNNFPFFVAFPSSFIDFSIFEGLNEIPIEIQDSKEVIVIEGISDNQILTIRLCSESTIVANFGFDIFPAYLITALLTEKGYLQSIGSSYKKIFSDKFN